MYSRGTAYDVRTICVDPLSRHCVVGLRADEWIESRRYRARPGIQIARDELGRVAGGEGQTGSWNWLIIPHLICPGRRQHGERVGALGRRRENGG
jgi:hypothetical protein